VGEAVEAEFQAHLSPDLSHDHLREELIQVEAVVAHIDEFNRSRADAMAPGTNSPRRHDVQTVRA
jgi:hypothetical protein